MRRLREEEFEQTIRIERDITPHEKSQRPPDRAAFTQTVIQPVKLLEHVEGRIGNGGLVEQDDLVTGFAVIGEVVFDGREVAQPSYFDTDLLADLAGDSLLGALAKLNRATQRAVENLACGRVLTFGDADSVTVPDDAQRDQARMFAGYV